MKQKVQIEKNKRAECNKKLSNFLKGEESTAEKSTLLIKHYGYTQIK